MLKHISSCTTPLCFTPNGTLVCYRYGNIVTYENGMEIYRFRIQNMKKERILGHIKIVNRLLRLGVRACIALDDSQIILSIGSKLLEFNISCGEQSNGFQCEDGVRPLMFTLIKDIKTFEDGVYFGGYVHNHKMHPVNIYRRVKKDDWEIVYTFQQGVINHVHNIIADPYRNCLWIFTGDFGDAAAIWKVTDNFNKIEKVASGAQRWRGSVAFVQTEGLLYATDTPRDDDYLYFLNPDTMEQHELMTLHGSCIYGCQWKNNYVLSSTVESDGGNMGFFENWFGRKRGKGIKDEYVHLYCGNMKEGFKEIYKEKKDWLPFTLFQFGAFKFPTGINQSNTLYFQPVATIKNDQRLMTIKGLY